MNRHRWDDEPIGCLILALALLGTPAAAVIAAGYGLWRVT